MKTEKPIVLVDVDGVLADFATPILDHCNALTGRSVPEQTAWNFRETFPELSGNAIYKPCHEPGFCESLKVYPGAAEAIEELRKYARVVAVTTPWWSSQYWQFERTEWLRKNLGFDTNDITFSSSKELVRGDFLVEDKPETIEAWLAENPGKQAFLWDRSYNRNASATLRRVDSWKPILDAVRRRFDSVRSLKHNEIRDQVTDTVIEFAWEGDAAIARDFNRCIEAKWSSGPSFQRLVRAGVYEALVAWASRPENLPAHITIQNGVPHVMRDDEYRGLFGQVLPCSGLLGDLDSHKFAPGQRERVEKWRAGQKTEWDASGDRGTGRTTRLIRGAPSDAFFVCNCPDSAIRLAGRALGGTPSKMRFMSFHPGHAPWTGTRSAVVVDHSVRVTPKERAWLEQEVAKQSARQVLASNEWRDENGNVYRFGWKRTDGRPAAYAEGGKDSAFWQLGPKEAADSALRKALIAWASKPENLPHDVAIKDGIPYLMKDDEYRGLDGSVFKCEVLKKHTLSDCQFKPGQRERVERWRASQTLADDEIESLGTGRRFRLKSAFTSPDGVPRVGTDRELEVSPFRPFPATEWALETQCKVQKYWLANYKLGEHEYFNEDTKRVGVLKENEHRSLFGEIREWSWSGGQPVNVLKGGWYRLSLRDVLCGKEDRYGYDIFAFGLAWARKTCPPGLLVNDDGTVSRILAVAERDDRLDAALGAIAVAELHPRRFSGKFTSHEGDMVYLPGIDEAILPGTTRIAKLRSFYAHGQRQFGYDETNCVSLTGTNTASGEWKEFFDRCIAYRDHVLREEQRLTVSTLKTWVIAPRPVLFVDLV